MGYKPSQQKTKMNFLQKYIDKVVFALNTNKIAICKQTFVPGQIFVQTNQMFQALATSQKIYFRCSYFFSRVVSSILHFLQQLWKTVFAKILEFKMKIVKTSNIPNENMLLRIQSHSCDKIDKKYPVQKECKLNESFKFFTPPCYNLSKDWKCSLWNAARDFITFFNKYNTYLLI